MTFINVLSLALLLSTVPADYTGHPSNGRFKGVVVDVKGIPIKAAAVTVDGKGPERKLESSASGEFEIDLSPGIYRITVEKAGFVKFELTNLEIKPKSKREFTFQLEGSQDLCEPICCQEPESIPAPPNL